MSIDQEQQNNIIQNFLSEYQYELKRSNELLMQLRELPGHEKVLIEGEAGSINAMIAGCELRISFLTELSKTLLP